MIQAIWNSAPLLNKFRLTDTQRKVSLCRRCGHNTTTTNEHGLCEKCETKAWERLFNDVRVLEAHARYNEALGIREA